MILLLLVGALLALLSGVLLANWVLGNLSSGWLGLAVFVWGLAIACGTIASAGAR